MKRPKGMGFWGWLLALGLLLHACAGDADYTAPSGTDEDSLAQSFFPMQIGAEYVYRYDSFVYNDFTQSIDTIRGFLRTRFVDTFRTEGDRKAYTLRRDYRRGDSLPWNPVSTWFAYRKGNELIVQEGNVPFLKQRYPLEEGATWDGNRYHGLEDDPAIDAIKYTGTYEVVQRFANRQVNGTSFSSVARVQQIADSSGIFNFRYFEDYAEDVGLVRRFRRDSLNDRPDYPRGFTLRQSLLEYHLPE